MLQTDVIDGVENPVREKRWKRKHRKKGSERQVLDASGLEEVWWNYDVSPCSRMDVVVTVLNLLLTPQHFGVVLE